MTLLEMAAAIAGAHEAMMLEGIPQEQRDRILARFTHTLTRCALQPRRGSSYLAPPEREDRARVDGLSWQEQAARDAGVPRSGPI